MTYSRDQRRLPRYAAGSRREPNRFLVLVAHDPLFNQSGGPRVTYPGKKVLGDAWLQSRGPWLVALHRNLTMGAEPHYDILRLVPTSKHWGQRPLAALHEAARREAEIIVRTWNEVGVKPTHQEDNFFLSCFTGRMQP